MPYPTVAVRLGVAPERCVVLEDRPPGVASGEAAGCAVVAVPGVAGVTFAPRPRRRVVRSLAEVDFRLLRSLGPAAASGKPRAAGRVPALA